MDQNPQENFRSSKELLRELQERSDDFDSVTVVVANDLVLNGPGGQMAKIEDCCSQIKLVNGESILIRREEFQTLLNDGVLQRLNIPINLMPQEKR